MAHYGTLGVEIGRPDPNDIGCRPPDVPAAVEHLSIAVARLEEIRNVLGDRLKPVMAPDGDSAREDKASALRPAKAPLAEQLGVVVERIATVNAGFDELLRRLEL